MARRCNRTSCVMMGDAEWLTYVKKLAESGLLMEQQTSLMVPAKFSPQVKK